MHPTSTLRRPRGRKVRTRSLSERFPSGCSRQITYTRAEYIRFTMQGNEHILKEKNKKKKSPLYGRGLSLELGVPIFVKIAVFRLYLASFPIIRPRFPPISRPDPTHIQLHFLSSAPVFRLYLVPSPPIFSLISHHSAPFHLCPSPILRILLPFSAFSPAYASLPPTYI